MSTEVQAACRRETTSVCVVTTSRCTNSLKLSHRQKSNSVRSGDRVGHRTGPTCLTQRSGYAIFNRSRTEAQECAGVPTNLSAIFRTSCTYIFDPFTQTVVVWKLGEGVPAQVSSSSVDHGSKLIGPSPEVLE
ncbi:uncharacterized protein TNCV_3303631 [Trichonephila clavipes]|nr:uncharacterized protein TNCV_3303631 [Trichonephila clavipes]